MSFSKEVLKLILYIFYLRFFEVTAKFWFYELQQIATIGHLKVKIDEISIISDIYHYVLNKLNKMD
ncbi:hypothetical protein [Fonticella tunisiensis]|uniref:hypothetical protein n=1 Tax=Fonticella tunisiensis TaxID=1096341 RepID=UPI0014151D70|nr:hypothetical protein [Fonticella tunisiensis]